MNRHYHDDGSAIHRFGKIPEVARERGLVAPAAGKIKSMAEEKIE